MPVHKRSLSVNATDEDSVRRSNQHHRAKQSRADDQELDETSEEEQEDEEAGETQKKRIVGGDDDDDEEEDEAEEEEERQDSEGSPSSSSSDKPEYVYVDLSEVRKEVQCPICLGIIKKTRTVMECLHRFCRECIDKSMRLGNNECPACRTHCASRRSLRDDPNFDSLIAALYPDINKYEEVEFAFHEEEKARNKQIQASIAEVVQRQSEACSKRRAAGKDPASGYMPRPQRNVRTPLTRRKKKTRGGTDHPPQESDDNEDENGAKDSSSEEELRIRKQRKRTAPRSSLSADDADVATRDNNIRGISPALVGNPEMLAWGRGGTRSNTRHGASNSSSKVSRNTRIAKLVERLRTTEENNEMDVHFMLVSLDKESMPTLKLPYICSRSSLSVGNLREYIAQQTHLQAQEVEILVTNNSSQLDASGEYKAVFPGLDSSTSEMYPLEEEDTLARIRANCESCNRHLVLGYRLKKTMATTMVS